VLQSVNRKSSATDGQFAAAINCEALSFAISADVIEKQMGLYQL
jgi:hypothetical protein